MALLPHLPMRRDNRLYLIGACVDGLVPGDAAVIGTEGGHGLDQVRDLGVEELAAVLGFDDVGAAIRSVVPAGHGEAIVRPVERQHEIIARTSDDDVEWIDAEFRGFDIGWITGD